MCRISLYEYMFHKWQNLCFMKAYFILYSQFLTANVCLKLRFITRFLANSRLLSQQIRVIYTMLLSYQIFSKNLVTNFFLVNNLVIDSNNTSLVARMGVVPVDSFTETNLRENFFTSISKGAAF